MKRYFTLLLLSILAIGSFAQTPIHVLTDNAIMRDAGIGVLVKDLTTGETLDAYNERQLLTPASCMKLLSTATALELLGADYRYSTYLETDGYVENGVLYGNLYVRGTGDPSLGSHKRGNPAITGVWAQELLKKGIRAIQGAVVADISAFNYDAINPGWLWEDMGNYYAPGIYALSYLDNTLQITLTSTAVGSMAEVVKVVPDYPGITWENHIRCVAKNEDNAFVHGVALSNTRYLMGSVPAGQGTFGLKGDMPNPGWFLAHQFTLSLRNAGVKVKEEARFERLPGSSNRTLLYEHRSRSLRELVAETNIHSNNHYAEHIFRSLGTRLRTPSSIQDAVDVERQCWDNRGVSFTSARLYDGCGLAPMDAVSAEQFVGLLTYMNGSKQQAAFYESLPIAGQSGTLKGLLAGTALEGRVHAKSGTITGVKSYAGYIEMPNGHRLAFAVIVNNSLGKMRAAQAVIADYLLALYNQYQ